MYDILLALHLLFAIFAVGPLVGAATTAARGVRAEDPVAAGAAARVLRIYSYASVLVVVFGFGLMSANDPDHPGRKVAQFGETWVWLSLLLWLAAVALVLGLVVPALTKVGSATGGSAVGGSATGGRAAGGGAAGPALAARVAAGGGTAALLFAVIVFLMVYRPGS